MITWRHISFLTGALCFICVVRVLLLHSVPDIYRLRLAPMQYGVSTEPPIGVSPKTDRAIQPPKASIAPSSSSANNTSTTTSTGLGSAEHGFGNYTEALEVCMQYADMTSSWSSEQEKTLYTYHQAFGIHYAYFLMSKSDFKGYKNRRFSQAVNRTGLVGRQLWEFSGANSTDMLEPCAALVNISIPVMMGQDWTVVSSLRRTALSHIRALHDIVKYRRPISLLLEQTVAFEPTFHSDLRKVIAKLPFGFDILFIGRCPTNHLPSPCDHAPPRTHFASLLVSANLKFCFYRQPSCSFAYVISYRGAQKLIRTLPITESIHVHISRLAEQYLIDDWKIFHMEEGLVRDLYDIDFNGSPLNSDMNCLQTMIEAIPEANITVPTGIGKDPIYELDKVYIVHYTPSISRFNHTMKATAEVQLGGELVQVFDRENMTDADRTCVHRPNVAAGQFHPMKKGEISSATKHLAIYYDVWRNGYETVLVLEDDAVFSYSFRQQLPTYMKELKHVEWDLIFIGTCLNIRMVFPSDKVSTHFYRCSQSRCAHGYVLSRRGAMRMLASLPLTAAIDISMNRAKQLLPDLQMYCAEPPLIEQLQTTSDTNIRN